MTNSVDMLVDVRHALGEQCFSEAYQVYFRLEDELVKRHARGDVLDVGCGKARAFEAVEGVCNGYIGIDRDESLLADARVVLTASTVSASTVLGDARYLNKYFRRGQFDTSICLWNTLPIIGNEKSVLQEIAYVTKPQGKILITLAARNEKAFAARRDYYTSAGIDFRYSGAHQTIYSAVWGRSPSYTLDDINQLGSDTKLNIVEQGALGFLGIYGLFSQEVHNASPAVCS